MKAIHEFMGLRDNESKAPPADFAIIYGVLGFLAVVGSIFIYQLLTF